MKVTTRVIQEIEMQMPLHGDELTAENLRLQSEARKAEVMAQLERDEWVMTSVTVNLVLFCDADQRRRVSEFYEFVPAADFASKKATRLDFGAWQNVRFKWSH